MIENIDLETKYAQLEKQYELLKKKYDHLEGMAMDNGDDLFSHCDRCDFWFYSEEITVCNGCRNKACETCVEEFHCNFNDNHLCMECCSDRIPDKVKELIIKNSKEN